MALPHAAVGWQCVIVVFPDNTYFLTYKKDTSFPEIQDGYQSRTRDEKSNRLLVTFFKLIF